jgi:hypothetical protein
MPYNSLPSAENLDLQIKQDLYNPFLEFQLAYLDELLVFQIPEEGVPELG